MQYQQQQQQYGPGNGHYQNNYRSNTTSMSSNSDHESHFSQSGGAYQQHQLHHLSYSSQTSTDANGLPSLDDYEAMLEQMASPNLGPRDVRSTNRRKEREPREPREPRLTMDRAARQARRQIDQQQQQQQSAAEAESLGGEKSFEERKVRRRSSLPSKLKATPNLFARLSRRSSGGGKSTSSPTTESPTLRTLVMDNGGPLPPPQQQQLLKGGTEHGGEFSAANPSLQAFAHLPALQEKRYSWESENVVPRMDLLSATKNVPSTEAARLPSWHDLVDSDMNPQVNVGPTPVPEPVQALNKPALTTQSHFRLSRSEDMDDEIITLVPIVEEEPEAQSSADMPVSATRHKDSNEAPIPPPRSSTPISRSRPSTPLGNIRPPPGPAPASSASSIGTAPISIPLGRKVSPTSKKPKPGHHKASPGMSGNVMLQPFALGASRPRTGSSSSNGSFTLDGIITPPPPSSPLPSLPPSSAGSLHGPPGEPMMVGLGIVHPHPHPNPVGRGRKASAGTRDLIRSPPQLFLQNDSRITHMIPPSTPPELGQTAVATAAAVAAASAAADLKAQQEKHERELQLTVRQIQDEKEALLQAMRERHERSHTEMVDQLDNYRAQLQTKEDEISRIRGAEQEAMEAFRRDLQAKEEEIERIRVQQGELQSVCRQLEDTEDEISRIRVAEQSEAERFQRLIQTKEEEILRIRAEQEELQTARHSAHDGENEQLDQEISKLAAIQVQLEEDLRKAQLEVRRLLDLVDEKERLSLEEKQTREAIVDKIDSLEQANRQSSEGRQQTHEAALSELDIQMRDLAAEKTKLEEANRRMKQELEAFEARSHQEEAQYRILQETVQRLSSKMSRMESQQAEELEQLQRDHEEMMDRVVHEHADAINHLRNQHQVELETELEQLRVSSEMDLHRYRHESERQFEQTQSQLRDASAQERQQMEARERVLRDRIDAQSDRNDQLEEELFQLQRAQDAVVKEKETLARTNRSLERHISMQHLQQQENVFKLEELERENARLKEILGDLDIAAALAARQHQQEQDSAEDEAAKETAMAEMFAQQQRKWVEQVEQMARKVARAEEEARRVAEQNVDLKVALDLATQSRSGIVSTSTAEHPKQQHSPVPAPVPAPISRPSTPPPTTSQSNGVMSPPLSA
ncbi:hypothetical protein BGX29_010851 [Mortierella sp. GBA35]|nr:hypothetical protein BGX29_010851 [Mortierella sp. GBA35]